ncbi:MAG: MFS transporter [Gemmatimonadetes bacterium]|nr:MFS transporter [Gemmatimonadota bacterium]MBT6147930.1 MFS transporter [Gemmatimonadota bacterium]MBT7864688.1 MFS transporter [Gemmatimonadota bacterium]
MTASAPQVSTQLSADQLRRGQAALIRYVAAGAANNALVGSTGALFLLSLGATPFQLGLLATFTQLDKIARLAGAELMRHTGKAGIMLWGRLLASPVTAGLAIAAAMGIAGQGAIWATIGVLAVRGALQQTGNAAWWPLIRDVTEGGSLGEFLSRMRTWQRLLELALPVAVGTWLGEQPEPTRFAPLFAVCVFVLLLAAWWIRGVPERPLPPTGESLWRRLHQVVSVPAIRRFCLYLGFRVFITSASFPFWVIVLTERGLPVSQFVWMTSLLALGQIATLWFWGRLVDRRGPRIALQVPLAGTAVLGAMWLFLPEGGGALLAWTAVLHLVWGTMEAGSQMGQSRVMVDAVPDHLQGEGFAIVIYASAIGGSLGGLLGGLGFEWVTRLGFDHTEYLAILQALTVVPLLLSLRLAPRST